MQRNPASRTGGMTLRQRNDHVGSPCQKTTGGPVALVDVRHAQPVDLAVVGREGEVRQPLGQLVGRADGVGHGVAFSRYGDHHEG